MIYEFSFVNKLLRNVDVNMKRLRDGYEGIFMYLHTISNKFLQF